MVEFAVEFAQALMAFFKPASAALVLALAAMPADAFVSPMASFGRGATGLRMAMSQGGAGADGLASAGRRAALISFGGLAASTVLPVFAADKDDEDDDGE